MARDATPSIPGRRTWLAQSGLLHNKEWSEYTEVRLTSVARGYGKIETELTQNVRELNLAFQPACDLVVLVTGDISAGYSVGLDPTSKKGDSGSPREYGRRNKFVRVDGEGRALLTGLQPGAFTVALAQTKEDYYWGAPHATADIVLRPGSQSITLAAPALYELVVHAPEFPAGEYSLVTWGVTNGSMRVSVPSGEVLFVPEKHDALRVGALEADKLAARAGLREGDLVLSISGRPVEGQMSAQRIYMDLQGGTALLHVLRGNTQIEVTVGPATTAQPWTEVGAQFTPTKR